MNSKLTAKYENNKLILEVYIYMNTYYLEMTKEQYELLIPVIRHIYNLGHRDGYNTRNEDISNILRSKPKDNIGSTAGLFTEALGFKLFS